ncbi:TrkA domain-containing protein [Candidatus Terasakiella magnetica]|uniref:TrkA domain-containing protein n=1 Tax=Candidatus Terasakiella magnetica TaxID=1867952 RepID=A0A1C3RKF8_9PROT|nr:SLC13 family permease [Candidatus Terasakiella magnetica]SCA57802.1 TrkA domain-containing protein [Candidatus Terasakiella magnetica]
MTELAIDIFGQNFQMWLTYIIILAALIAYAVEDIPVELTSLVTLGLIMVIFHIFPVVGEDGHNLLSPRNLLLGFANTGLITVLALLVVGQGMVRTGVLERGAQLLLQLGGKNTLITILLTLIVGMLISSMLNNIPVVVIFIPIMQALAARINKSASKVMMPLSAAAVLGGMITLIGSGTNLLVNSALIQLGEVPFKFFDFTIPGLVLASIGLVYVVFVMPRLLPDRSGEEGENKHSGKHFIAQLSVAPGAKLVGKKSMGGFFIDLPDMTVRMIQNRGESILPPFEDHIIQPGDILVVAATRKTITEVLTQNKGLLEPHHPELIDKSFTSMEGEDSEKEAPEEEEVKTQDRMLVEVMLPPTSQISGQTLQNTTFAQKSACKVIGIQRRSRMIRARMDDIRLQSGDVLLVQGHPSDIHNLRSNRDVILLEWSKEELPAVHHARRALAIFASVVVLAGTGILPTVTCALLGATAMVGIGALNVRQAVRAVDSKIVTMVGAALALGSAMQATGAASYLAHSVVDMLDGAGPRTVLSVLFLLIAILTNVLSTQTCAVLFTPIAVSMANELGVDPRAFAVAVVFAANCAFATPIGYQTNLLVMAPGRYSFKDFIVAGTPLVFIIWIAFSLFIPSFYGF